jgi:hypothetical protein
MRGERLGIAVRPKALHVRTRIVSAIRIGAGYSIAEAIAGPALLPLNAPRIAAK